MNHFQQAVSDLKKAMAKQQASTKLWQLTYRGQIIVNSASYLVCNGKKSELIKQGYGAIHFKIKPFK